MEPTTKQVMKARRSAINAKTFHPCAACSAYGNRCSGFRPCSRCLKLSKSCVSVDSFLKRAGVTAKVERPVVQTRFALEISEASQPVKILHLVPDLGWGSDQLKRFSAMGHTTGYLTQFLLSRSDLLTPICETVRKIADIFGASVFLANRTIGFSGPGPSTRYFDSCILDGSEPFWSVNTSISFLSITYDSESKRRRHLIASPGIASLVSMHHEEYLARVANNDLALPCTKLDSLLLFLFMTIRDTCTSCFIRETYIRMCSGSGLARRAYLVHHRSIILSNAQAGADSQVTLQRRANSTTPSPQCFL